MRVKDDQPDALICHQQLANRLLEQVIVHFLVESEEQSAIGFGAGQDIVIDGVLSNRLLEIRHFRGAKEALHLNRDLPLAQGQR
jgi:hypothetical protein